MRIAASILRYLRPHRLLVLATIASVIMVTGASLLAPWPMKVLVDSVLGDQPLPGILAVEHFKENRYIPLVLVVASGFLVVLLQNSLNVLKQYVNTRLKLKITLDFRSDLFQHAQRLSLAYHDSTYSGKLVYLLTDQANGLAGLLMTIPTLIQGLLTFAGMFLVLLTIDHQLALISLLVIPFLFHTVNSYASRIHQPLHRVKDLEGQTLSMIQEAMTMLRIIVAFGREAFEWGRFRNQGEQALNARVEVTVRQGLFELTVNLITAAGLALVVGVGAVHILQGILTVGELLVIIAYISAVYQSLGTISATVGSLQDQVVSIERAFEVLDIQPDVRDCENAKELTRSEGAITFQNVHFAYRDGSQILRGMSFHVQPGEHIGIVGPTGAGKTTMVSLIPRFYDPQQGCILIDQANVRGFTLQSLRKQISIVGQDPILFVGTIAENIQYGRLDARHEEIVSAAQAANAHEFIMRLPDGYDTEVGERGAGLSGGERQRISIARSFLKNAPILILDEPTAHIDQKTEADVVNALHELRKGRTTITISHRIAAIRGAHRILVVNDGRIVEILTHAELAEREGFGRKSNTLHSEQLTW